MEKREIPKTTMKEAITLFTNFMFASSRTKSSISAYKNDLTDFEEYIKMKHPSLRYVQQIRLNEIIEYQTYLTSYVEVGEYSARTKDRRMFCLRAFMSYLYKAQLISHDLIAAHEYHKSAVTESPNYLEKDDLDVVLDVIAKSGDRNWIRDYALFACLRYLGVRRREVLNLRWSKVNFPESTIEVYHQKTQNFTVVLMHQMLQDALLKLYAVTADKTLDYIFISNKNNRMSETAFNNSIKKYVSKAELGTDFNITSRTFRHSFCTNLSKANVSDDKIIRYTGHSSKDSLKYYTKLKTKDLSDLVSCL